MKTSISLILVLFLAASTAFARPARFACSAKKNANGIWASVGGEIASDTMLDSVGFRMNNRQLYMTSLSAKADPNYQPVKYNRFRFHQVKGGEFYLALPVGFTQATGYFRGALFFQAPQGSGTIYMGCKLF